MGQIRPTPVEIDQEVANFAENWSKSTRNWPNWFEIAQDLAMFAKLGPSLTDFGKKWPKLAKCVAVVAASERHAIGM